MIMIMIFVFACTGAPSSASADGESFSWFTIKKSLELECNDSQVIVSSLALLIAGSQHDSFGSRFLRAPLWRPLTWLPASRVP